MQVIKFRGRSIADGSIVYGGVLQYATASYIVHPTRATPTHHRAALRCTPIRWRNTPIGKLWTAKKSTPATRLNTSMTTYISSSKALFFTTKPWQASK